MERSCLTALIFLAAVATACGPKQAPGESASAVQEAASVPNNSENSPNLRAIPIQYRGRWAGKPSLCDDPSGDSNAMIVESEQITFWESFGRVLSVTAQGERRISIRIEYSESTYDDATTPTDGKESLLDFTLSLSSDSQTIETIYEGKTTFIRHRCSPENIGGPGADAA